MISKRSSVVLFVLFLFVLRPCSALCIQFSSVFTLISIPQRFFCSVDVYSPNAYILSALVVIEQGLFHVSVYIFPLAYHYYRNGYFFAIHVTLIRYCMI